MTKQFDDTKTLIITFVITAIVFFSLVALNITMSNQTGGGFLWGDDGYTTIASNP